MAPSKCPTSTGWSFAGTCMGVIVSAHYCSNIGLIRQDCGSGSIDAIDETTDMATYMYYLFHTQVVRSQIN
jgi:hypothetical protein